MIRVVLVVAAIAVSCTADTPELVPIVEVPSSDSDAYPYAAIDTLELSVARAGDSEPISLVSGEIGETLSLDGIAFGGDLVVHLSGRSGNSELAYGRTCTLTLESGAHAEPLLYFSRIVRWAKGPQLVTQRSGSLVGIALRGGSLALFWSGELGGLIDVLDPSNLHGVDRVRSLERELVERRDASASLLGDGVLVVGGKNASGDAVASIEQIRPTEQRANNQIVVTDGPRLVAHESIELQDGSVLVTGGLHQALAGGAYAHSEVATVFSLLEGDVTLREIRPGLAVPRTGHSMTRLGNEVGADILIVGGQDALGQGIDKTELYRPLRGAFENIEGALLATPRFDHQAVRLPGGFVLVIGGATMAGGSVVPVREIELYDPVQGLFSPAGVLPSSAGVTGMSVTELPDGRVLLAGGEDIDGQKVNTVLIARFDPIDGVVDLSPTAPLAEPRSEHAAVVLCDGTVLLSGGTSTMSAETERYNPPSTGRR